MNNIIDVNHSIYQITEEHPELIEFFAEFGFTPLKNNAMRTTVGKVTSLRRGCKLINVSLETIVRELEINGYEVKGYDTSDYSERTD